MAPLGPSGLDMVDGGGSGVDIPIIVGAFAGGAVCVICSLLLFALISKSRKRKRESFEHKAEAPTKMSVAANPESFANAEYQRVSLPDESEANAKEYGQMPSHQNRDRDSHYDDLTDVVAADNGASSAKEYGQVGGYAGYEGHYEDLSDIAKAK